MTEPADGQEVDGTDEADHDSMETALGVALAALLLAELLPGPASFNLGPRSWFNRVDAALGQTLRGFIERTAFDLVQEAGANSTQAAHAANEVYPRVLAKVEEWSHDTLQHLTDDHLDDDGLAARVTSAAENLARGVAAYAKGETRENTASRIGVVWKIWRSRHDDRVRASHHELNGEKVPFNGRFFSPLTNSYLRYPGDPEGPLEETMGCRCHCNFRLRPGIGSTDDVSSGL